METQHLKLLVGKKEAATTLGIGLRSVEYLIAQRELETRRIGRRVLIPISALERFAKRDHPFPISKKRKKS